MRVLKVQGKARVNVEPDIVTISFEVEAKARGYADCIRKLNTRTEELRGNVVATGLALADLKTTSFSIRVDTRYEDGQHHFVGYRASHNLHIELPVDKELLNRVLRQIAQGHSGTEIRLAFSVKDKDGLRKRVLAEAVRTAKENAAALAAAAGITLGTLQQIDYGWAEVRIYDCEASMVGEAPPPCPPHDYYEADIDPEDVGAEDSVTLVYEIED